MNWIDLLGLRNVAVTALVGAGGKTSAMFRLARAWAGPVFAGNSAHLGVAQAALAERAYVVARSEDFPDFRAGIPPGVTLFSGAAVPERERLDSLAPEALERLRRIAADHGVPLLIEADGSRCLPLKAPASHEPPIPAFADAVVVCAGLSGLGQPLSDEGVFRAERFAALSGQALGTAVTPAGLARVLTDSQGGLKGIPVGALRLALLNQADTPERTALAGAAARPLLRAFSGVAAVSLNGPGPQGVPELRAYYTPTAGIVLAAGASSRFGSLKQLLDWQGEALVRRAARAALESGLDPVVVVVGAQAERVTAALEGLRVAVAACPDWQAGQSASLKAGLAEALRLRPDLGGALFLLADQPYVGPELIGALVDCQAGALAPAAAPRVGERRANPVLFARSQFGALMALEGDAGGRQILAGLGLAFLDWRDERILRDIDTLEDYRSLR